MMACIILSLSVLMVCEIGLLDLDLCGIGFRDGFNIIEFIEHHVVFP